MWIIVTSLPLIFFQLWDTNENVPHASSLDGISTSRRKVPRSPETPRMPARSATCSVRKFLSKNTKNAAINNHDLRHDCAMIYRLIRTLSSGLINCGTLLILLRRTSKSRFEGLNVRFMNLTTFDAVKTWHWCCILGTVTCVFDEQFILFIPRGEILFDDKLSWFKRLHGTKKLFFMAKKTFWHWRPDWLNF